MPPHGWIQPTHPLFVVQAMHSYFDMPGFAAL